MNARKAGSHSQTQSKRMSAKKSPTYNQNYSKKRNDKPERARTVNQVEKISSSSDEELQYTFKIDSKPKVRAPYVSLQINGNLC